MAVRDDKLHVKVECFEGQREQRSKCAEPGGGSQPLLALRVPPAAPPRLALHEFYPVTPLICLF